MDGLIVHERVSWGMTPKLVSLRDDDNVGDDVSVVCDFRKYVLLLWSIKLNRILGVLMNHPAMKPHSVVTSVWILEFVYLIWSERQDTPEIPVLKQVSVQAWVPLTPGAM